MATGRLPDPNTAPVTAKGDLYTYSTVPAKLAVGNNGETLVADSSATTGLRWQGNFAAGKNKIINGDFYINQRGFTSNTTSGAYNFDRWRQGNGGTTGTFTVTPQTFTTGTAPVAGYEGKTFLQGVTAAGASVDTNATISQRLEDVRTFAGQTVTFSFFAKADTGTPKLGLELVQNFGTGGSPSADVQTQLGSVTLSTSWARYSLTVAVPSISGKTIGTDANSSYLAALIWVSAGSNFATRASSIGLQNFTLSLWGVQIETGNTATAFQTATGTLAGELAACQRYYFRNSNSSKTYAAMATLGVTNTTTNFELFYPLPVTMRTAPTSVEFSNLRVWDYNNSLTVTAATLSENTATVQQVAFTVSGAVAGRVAVLQGNNNSAAYLGFSAEL